MTDNQHNGGIAYPVDLDSGCICGAGVEVSGKRHFCHPQTGLMMAGREIPNWQELLLFVKKAALVVPQVRMAAWDVAVLEQGFEMIEGNDDGNPDVMQGPAAKGKLREILKWAK